MAAASCWICRRRLWHVGETAKEVRGQVVGDAKRRAVERFGGDDELLRRAWKLTALELTTHSASGAGRRGAACFYLSDLSIRRAGARKPDWP